ncbi:hypothetical protein K458DRAFT_297285 [Lentithecium fluviatile CBS 122367]|uniref:EH domain-containing protein n=1 Tax=Lentithecium fluviatile CBS 122367 TaxID=1168545 RepID=A0A6G1J8U5_9PLEO|nr:hypothetical protein K458DRAFT_297285 [Lentithecium fluviatile CBS 122367]
MSSTSARISPQVPQTTGDTQYNVRNAALRGASSAFSKPPVKPKPQTNTYTGGSNGALLAATKVGTGTPRALTPSGNTSPLRKNWTGGSTSAGRPYTSPTYELSHSSSSSALAVPDDSLFEQVPSPSNIAAKLAAARYSPMRPLPQASAVSGISERDANEGDILPPAGSVGNVLARLDSTKPKAPGLRKRRSFDPNAFARPIRTLSGDSKPTDDTPIAPTNALVNLFEQNRSTAAPRRTPSPMAVPQKAPPPVRSPKPQRTFHLPPEPKDNPSLERAKTLSPPAVKPKPWLDISSATDGIREGANFSALRRDTFGVTAGQKPAQSAAAKNVTPRPNPPPKRGTRQTRPRSEDISLSASIHRNRRLSSSLSNHEIPSSPSSFVSAREVQEEEKPKPSLPPPRRSARPKTEQTGGENRPKTATPLSPERRSASKLTSPIPPPQKFSPPRRASVSGSSTPTGGTLYHNNYQRESVRAITKHLTGESLSSAIVGAALASSRNASPAPASTATPTLPMRRQQLHHHSLFHRSPSPPKPQPTGKLRPTMRREPSSSSDEDESEKYKRKGTRIMGMGRKHPNKHHEGTRKRWRDQVTERERKRYEGVWAANKGLHIPSSHSPSRSRSPGQFEEDPALEVLNLVVKEIWSRSRLPEHALEEVWDLVDGRGVGRLRREEFVVGLWLVDQRLKGRKLPLRVSESVWASVRGAGVKIKVKLGPHR